MLNAEDNVVAENSCEACGAAGSMAVFAIAWCALEDLLRHPTPWTISDEGWRLCCVDCGECSDAAVSLGKA